MAAFTHTHIDSAPIASRLAGAMASFSDAYARHKTYRKTVAELQSLTGRELADIGLNRSMIKSVATEAAYGTK